MNRGPVFRSDVVVIHDNRCCRTDPEVSPPTEPLPFHEVCLPRSGVWVRHLEGRELPVTPGTVHFLNRGEVHQVSHPRRCGDRNTGLLFAEEALEAIVQDANPEALDRDGLPFSSTHDEISSEVQILHAVLLRCLEDAGHEREVLAEELALHIVERVLRSAAEDASESVPRSAATARRHHDLVLDARCYLGLHYGEALGITDLARAVGSSPHHLSRVFRAETGSTIHRHLLRLRLTASLERIAGGEDLADVAAATGFADRTHLSRRFSAAFGLSPSAFRRTASDKLVRRLLS